MKTKATTKRHNSETHESDFAFRIITLVHDNPLLPLFKDPGKLLKAAGLGPAQSVLEVGCGPGYFTLPAAKIVGDRGRVYAIDVHPKAIQRVQRKLAESGIQNVQPLLTNASETGLPDNSIDRAFIFGMPHVVGGQEKVIAEIRRLLGPGGELAYMKSRGSESGLIKAVEKGGLSFSRKEGRILIVKKGF